MKVSQAKLKKLANVTRKILNVFFWLVSILAGIVGIVFLSTFFFPDTTFIPSNYEGLTSKITIAGMISYNIDSSISLKPFLQIFLPATMIMGIFMAIVTRQLSLILKTVQEDCPFDEKNPVRLSIIAMIMFISSIVINFAQFFVAKRVVEMLEIPNMNVDFRIDIESIFMGILILILAGVFKYGNYLQKEYDATL